MSIDAGDDGPDEPTPVDFVVGADLLGPMLDGAAGEQGAAVEDLDQGAGPDPHRRRTRMRVLAAVAVLALVLIGVTVYNRPDSQPVARPVTSVQPAPPLPSVVTLPGPQPVSMPASLVEPPQCPEADDGQSACRHMVSVPAAFTHAVHDRFPRLRQRSATTDELRTGLPLSPGGLWSRTYVASDHQITLRIAVGRGKRDNGSGPPMTIAVQGGGSHTRFYCSQIIGSYTVQIQVMTDGGTRIDEGPPLALLTDARLTALH